MQAGTITYLKRDQINEKKWNACIDTASNGMIYAYSFYLDEMTDNWDALVLDDYAAVMPLPWRKKWSLFYIYYPFVTAQLGVFGKRITADLFASFLNAVPPKYKLWDLPLNHQNLFAVEGYPLQQRSNFVLSLNRPYEIIANNYRENAKRNIKKNVRYGCKKVKEISIDQILSLTKEQAKEVDEKNYQNFERLFKVLQPKGMAKTYGILSAKDELLAAAVFFFSHKRAYYILVGNHPDGRTLGASHALIDAFIFDHAEQDLLLDFEGSDVPSLQFFYGSFGATDEPYGAIKLNRLPWWAKWKA